MDQQLVPVEQRMNHSADYHSHSELNRHSTVLLATVQALLITPVSDTCQVRLLLDSGSELSFITNKLANRFQLIRQRSTILLTGIGNTAAGRSKGLCQFALQSIYSDARIQVQAHILPSLTTTLPSYEVDCSSWSHLKGLQLADPNYNVPGNIDIILGSVLFAQIICSETRKAQASDPTALRTLFGWVVFGPTNRSQSLSISPALHIHQDNALQELLTKFWVQEESPHALSAQLSSEEEHCEAHFINTFSRSSTGKYIVRLPIVPSPKPLGESINVALRCLKSMLKRLSKDPKLDKLYKDFMSEYEVLGHMRLAPDALTNIESSKIWEERTSKQSDSPIYYLPHHGVLREQSLSTKLRVVFNGSAQTSSGFSLNDILHTGAKLQLDIFDVLLWVRRHKIIFSTDITKMFRQIEVHPEDWDLQRILWLDHHNNIVPYQLTTVTYGTRPAPFLAGRVMLQLVQDEGFKYPLAIPPMTKGRYVDDIFGGSDTLHETQLIAQDLIQLCKAGSLPLAKWSSNSSLFPRGLSLENVSSTQPQALDDTELKVLGLSWNPSLDQFLFDPKISTIKKATKRFILSEVAQLFDPLGFLAPVIVRAKMFIQELWLNKSGWDDELPEQLADRWAHIRDELPLLDQVRIPRWLNIVSSSYIEVHGFSDASQLAMAACIYIRVVNSEEQTQATLLCAKTKVAPLKPVTIPRLELNAAWILSKLARHVLQVLQLAHAPVYLWTDSSVVLTWILSHPSKWKEFVRNRVASIQELNPTAKWHYVPGKQNPADCASRGLAPARLINHELWWNGPKWLSQSNLSWPAQQFKPSSQAHTEERPGISLYTTKVVEESSHPLWYLISKYSSLYKLLRITALCMRFISILRKKESSSLALKPLTPQEQLDAQLTWVRIIQQIHFSSELKALREGLQLPQGHFISKLTAFIDHQGVLRVGGRLQNAQLDEETIHPMILPRKSQLTYLVIARAHLSTLHGGTQLTLINLRQSFWVIGGRAPVRSYILKCVTCARYRAQRAQQLMGQLPASRVTPVRPFHTTGVDYAGPFLLKTFQGRGAKTYKSWIAVFVCFVSSAIHLEVVTDYSTEAFLKAYRRFVSRRGVSSVLYSDCGTNFQGANKFLKQLFRSGFQENAQLVHSLARDGTRWIFSPPSAPHFGGKWEAAVKSVKFHLVRVIGDTLLTYEDFSTLLAQVEAVLNSRPLSALSDDPEDLYALTPAHFLTGSAPTILPEQALTNLPESRLALWQLIQQKLQHLWQRWSKECLQRYLAIAKWHRPDHHIKLGSLVLVTDERYPPGRWPLARVIEIHPGKDGLTRVVTVRTATTTLIRPIVKLVLLPVDSFSTSSPEGGENVTEP